MDQYHERIKGKTSKGTGAKKEKNRDKKLAHVGGTFIATKPGKEKRKIVRVRGGNKKVKLQRGEYINVSTKEGTKKVKIKKVIKSNTSDYTRQSIITKGTVVDTELGFVKITSRPGQHGILNGIPVKKEEE